LPTSLLVIDGKNYDKWCVQRKVIFDFQEVINIVNGFHELGDSFAEAQRKTYHEAKKKDYKTIQQCGDSTNFANITYVSTAKEANILEKSYTGAWLKKMENPEIIIVECVENFRCEIMEKVLRILTLRFDHN
ncbi:hypothetical protein CR513_35995, partial [Mucuna pruriens]